MKKFQKLTEKEISLVQQLAREIWDEHYTPIIGKAQIDYMLGKFYSTEKISSELKSGVFWEILYFAGEPSGYLVCEPEADRIHLAKIYLKSNLRGQQLGMFMLERAKEIAVQTGKNAIYLNVNKNNINAIKFYEKSGFKRVEDGVFDIGNGFVMDDYIYELRLA